VRLCYLCWMRLEMGLGCRRRRRGWIRRWLWWVFVVCVGGWIGVFARRGHSVVVDWAVRMEGRGGGWMMSCCW
jgi:hypothetical protein